MEKIIKHAFTFLALVYCTTFFSQQAVKAPSPQSEKQFTDSYLKKNYSLLGRAESTIKAEGKIFVVLIFNKNGEDTLSKPDKPIKRITLVLMGKSKNELLKVVENKNLVYHYEYDMNFKECFTDVTASDSKFSIGHYGGFATRWSRGTSFVYAAKEKTWLFSSDEQSTFLSADPENEKEQTETITTAKQTGRITCAKFDIYKPLK